MYQQRYNFVYYGTGKNYKQYQTMINKANKNKFKTILLYVEIDIQIAKSRSKKRSRIVNNSVINSIYESLQQKQPSGKYKGLTNVEILKEKTDEWYKYDNTTTTTIIDQGSK